MRLIDGERLGDAVRELRDRRSPSASSMLDAAAIRFGRVAVDLVRAHVDERRSRGSCRRAASSRFSVPTALVSKSSNGIAAARSWTGCAAACTIDRRAQRRDELQHARADRGCRARDARTTAARARAAAGSSGCRPAGRRTRRAGCCRRRGTRKACSAKYPHTSLPIRPEEPVTRITLSLGMDLDIPKRSVARQAAANCSRRHGRMPTTRNCLPKKRQARGSAR